MFRGMSRMGATVVWPMAIAATTLGTANASAEPGGESQWSLSAGTEYGHDSSRGSMMSLDYAGKDDADAAENTSHVGQAAFGLSGLHTDTPAPVGSPTPTATTVTTSGQVYFRYGIEALRGGVAFDSTSDENYRHSQQWTGMLHSGAHGWAIDVDVSTRQTRFDAFPIEGTAASQLDQTIAADGDANCTLHDTGYGGTLTYATESWTVYGSGGANSYDKTACSFSVAVPSSLQRLDSNGFQQIAGAFLDRAQVRAGGQIGQQTQLLQSQYAAGVSRSWGRTVLAFDYLHTKSEFGDAIQDGYALSGTIPVLKAVAVKLTVGTTVTDSASAPYGGLYVLIDL